MRAHVEAKAANMPLIVGSQFRLTAADGSPALAMNRDAYGNLCEFISLGRVRSKKGTCRLAPLDLEPPEVPYTNLSSLSDCVAILSPDFPANEQRLDAQVEWLARVFGDPACMSIRNEAPDPCCFAHLPQIELGTFFTIRFIDSNMRAAAPGNIALLAA